MEEHRVFRKKNLLLFEIEERDDDRVLNLTQDDQEIDPRNPGIGNRNLQDSGPFTPEGHEPSTRAGYTQPMSQKGFKPQNRLGVQTQNFTHTVPQTIPNTIITPESSTSLNNTNSRTRIRPTLSNHSNQLTSPFTKLEANPTLP